MGHNPLNNGLSSGKNNGSAQLADNYPDFPVTAKLMDDRSLLLSRHGFPDGSGKTMPFSELMETLHGGGGGDGGERVGAGVGGGGFKNPPPSATFANIKISSSIIKNSVNAGLHLNSTTSSTTNSVTSINAGSSASASAAASAAAAATGTICKSALTGGTDRCIASTLMDAFKKSLTFNDCGFPTLDLPKNDMCLSELVLKYEKKKKPGASGSSSRKTSTSASSSSSSALHKTFCIACTTREVVPQVKPSNDFFGYLSELLCTPCISKLKKTKAVSEIEASEKKRETEKKKKEKETAANEEEKLLPELQLLKEKMGAQGSLFKNKRSGGRAMGVTVDEELNGCWMEIRNAIYQVFLEEGFTLNPVVEAYISPGLCRYCLPPTSMLRAMVKRLYHAHQHKFFLLTVCHVQLFIMEIKLTLLRELVHLEKRPYFIFAVFYSLFQRLLRALRRTNRFLDLIEEEFLKKNALYWLQIHFLFFQTFVYMNRFIQKSISLLCDCSTENGLHTEDSEEGRLVGKIVYRSYIILEQSMASFSMCTNASSASFAAFFTKFDDVSTELGESSTSGLSSGMNGSCMEGGSSSQKLSSIRKGREAGKKRGRELGKRGGGGGSGSSHPAAAAVPSELPMYPVFHLQTLVNITLSHLLFDHYHPASIASPLTSGDCSVQFQMLFQFAILLFNCKNYDENIFAKRFLATDYAVKSLQAMPGLPAELMAVDGLNTVAFQLFLVIHHWDSTEVFDNVMRRLPTVECSRSSRSIIKTILTESFNEVGYEERKLLADFYAMMDVPMPTSSGGEAHEAAAVASFDSLLAQEIALSDEEAYDEEGLGGSYDALDYDEPGNCLEAIHHHHHAHHGGHGHGHGHHSHSHHGGGGGGGPAGHGGFGSCYPPHDCDCYADIFGDPAAAAGAAGGGHHGGAHSSLFPPVPPPAPPSRRSALEVRERLRQKISTRKQRVNQLVENCNAAATALATAHANNETAPSDPASFTAGAGAEAVIDDRKIDDLLSFINGGDENEEGGGGNKKRKSKTKKKTKQSKKQKNKEDSSGGNGNGNGKKNGQTSLEKAKLPKQKPTPSISKVDDEEELEEELEYEEEEEEEEEVVELLSSVEVKQEKEEVRKEERAKPSPKVNGHAKTTAAANKPLPPKSTFSSDKAKTKAKTKTSAPINRTATPPPPPPLTKAVISNGGAQTNGLDDGDGDNEEEEGDEEGEEDDDLQEEKEEEEFSDEENNKHLASEESSSSDEQQLVELNISNPEEVFMPTDIDLDSEDIDDFEKDLERFKRFCYDTICGYTLDSCKLKLAINVKEIFSRGAAATKPSTTAHNSNNACFAASSVGGAPQ